MTEVSMGDDFYQPSSEVQAYNGYTQVQSRW